MSQPIRHVILDRDGVLNREREGRWVLSPADWEWEDGALAGLAALGAAHVEVSVVTNQSCVGRGLAREADVASLHDWMLSEARRVGGCIGRVFVCPHAPDAGCACRKPRPGLVLQAVRDSGIAPGETVLVGDDVRDITAAREAGIRAILTRTGKGRSFEPLFREGAIEVYGTLAQAVSGILDTSTEHAIARAIDEHRAVFDAYHDELRSAAFKTALLLAQRIRSGGKILAFGNGGSASDAQHFVGELVGRFLLERRALPAIALATDGVSLTAIANDYSFDVVFARQIEAFARPGDVAVAISTSGNSRNVLAGARRARELGCDVVGLTGAGGGALAALCDTLVAVPSKTVARIQELHGLFLHVVAQAVEQRLSAAGGGAP